MIIAFIVGLVLGCLLTIVGGYLYAQHEKKKFLKASEELGLDMQAMATSIAEQLGITLPEEKDGKS